MGEGDRERKSEMIKSEAEGVGVRGRMRIRVRGLPLKNGREREERRETHLQRSSFRRALCALIMEQRRAPPASVSRQEARERSLIQQDRSPGASERSPSSPSRQPERTRRSRPRFSIRPRDNVRQHS